MDRYKVTLVSKIRSPQIAAVRVHNKSADSLIEISFNGTTLTGTGGDFFDAFCCIRKQLEPMGLLPHCYAAHRCAYPSGMSRSMGEGIKLYRLTLHKQALKNDLIHMFESDDNVEPATVADQRAFFNYWISSLA